MGIVFDLITLFGGLIILIFFQTTALFGIFFGIHYFMEPITIEEVDFDHFSQPLLIKFLPRAALGIAIPAVVFHFVFFILHYNFILRSSIFNPILLSLLEFGALYALCHILFHLDPKKSAAAAAVSALFYLLLYAIFVHTAIA